MLAVLPFGGDVAADRRPVAALERRAHRDGDVADAREAALDLAIAVDVALGDVPVVDAGVARRAGVGEDQARLAGPRVRRGARRGGRRRRRARPPRRRRRARAGSPARRSARRSPAPRRSSRSGSSWSSGSGRSVHAVSAPHTAMFSADEPAMPAPTGESDRRPQLEPLRPGSGGAAGRAAAARCCRCSSLQCAASTRWPVSSETITIRRSARGWIVQRARRLIAAFSVCAPSWNR